MIATPTQPHISLPLSRFRLTGTDNQTERQQPDRGNKVQTLKPISLSGRFKDFIVRMVASSVQSTPAVTNI
jgi:hypothetical protein